MILHKSSCTADTTLCTATYVGIMVVRNVATIKTEHHQHTCINQKCVGGTDNYSVHDQRETRVYDCDCLPCGMIECRIEQYYMSMQSMQIIVLVAQVAPRSKAPTTVYIPYSMIFMIYFLGNVLPRKQVKKS